MVREDGEDRDACDNSVLAAMLGDAVEDLIAQIRAAIDGEQRRLDAARSQPGGDTCERGGHWDEDEIERHLVADRKLLDMFSAKGDDLEVDVPGEHLCDDWCVRVVGQHVLSTLAEAYGITVE